MTKPEAPVFPGHPTMLALQIVGHYDSFEDAARPDEQSGQPTVMLDQRINGSANSIRAAMCLLLFLRMGESWTFCKKMADQIFVQECEAKCWIRLGVESKARSVLEGKRQADRAEQILLKHKDWWKYKKNR